MMQCEMNGEISTEYKKGRVGSRTLREAMVSKGTVFWKRREGRRVGRKKEGENMRKWKWEKKWEEEKVSENK